jgi:hypothetical protein
MSQAILPFLAFTEADAGRAYREFGFNCGPAALAACLGLTPNDVRPHLPPVFEARRYMNPTQMGQALMSLGCRWRPMPYPLDDGQFPVHGLVRVQWSGTWLKPGVPVGAAYARTHWVASKFINDAAWVYDINGGWQTRVAWEAQTVPLILAEVRGADGTWHPTHRWEVMR